MHDDRRLVEQRVERVLRERIRPAQYAASTPLALEAWHVPGEPVPVTQALAPLKAKDGECVRFAVQPQSSVETVQTAAIRPVASRIGNLQARNTRHSPPMKNRSQVMAGRADSMIWRSMLRKNLACSGG